MAWPGPTWNMKESHVGGATPYRVKTSTTVAAAEAQRFYDHWKSKVSPFPTSAGVISLGTVDDAGNQKISIETFDIDPEDAHEDLVDDIKTVEDDLEAADTQVTQANTVSTGEIAVYASGKIIAAIADP